MRINMFYVVRNSKDIFTFLPTSKTFKNKSFSFDIFRNKHTTVTYFFILKLLLFKHANKCHILNGKKQLKDVTILHVETIIQIFSKSPQSLLKQMFFYCR